MLLASPALLFLCVSWPWSSLAQTQNVYSGCGSTAGCFGLGGGDCVAKANCDAVVTYATNQQGNVQFNLQGPLDSTQPSYVAVGLSSDSSMGSDSVVACYSGPSPGVAMSWNTDSNSNVALANAQLGLANSQVTVSNGKITCSFTRDSSTSIPVPNSGQTVSFDLKSTKYHLLLAYGPLASTSPAALGYHAHKVASNMAFDFSANSVESGSSASDLAIRFHAGIMIVVWYLIAPCGIFTARYMKAQFCGRQLWGKDVWFRVHQLCMGVTWTLVVAAFFIVVGVDGVDPLDPDAIESNPHAAIGMAAVALTFIQPFMAALRCGPQAKYRFIFNYVHSFVGLSASLLAIVAAFFATQPGFALTLANGASIVAVVYIAVFIAFHFAMTLAYCCTKTNCKVNNNEQIESGRQRWAAISLRIGFALFILVCVGFAVAMIVFIAMS